MLDVKFIRENTEKCKTRLAMRGKSYDEEIDTALALDQKRRDIIGKVEAMKAEENKVSKSIPQLKKAGEDVSAVLAQMKELSQEVKALDAEQAEVEQQLHDTLLTIPNVPADKVPEGADDTCNPELRRWSEPRAFDFEPKAHWDIGKDLGILDPDTAAKVTGSRFHSGACSYQLLPEHAYRQRLHGDSAAVHGKYRVYDRHRSAAEVCRGYVSSGKHGSVSDSDS